MKKGAKQLIILSALLVICIGAYIIVSVSNSNAAKKAAEEAEAALLYAPDRGQPVSISFGGGGGEMLSFAKGDGVWTYTGDPDFPLDQKYLTRIVSSLTGLTAVRTLDMPQNLSDYGLDEPAHSLMAADESGKTFKLSIGIANGDNYYAMIEGQNSVYTIPSTLVGYLDVGLYDTIILDKITDVSEDSIETITLTTEEMTLVLDKHKEKDGSFTWFVVEGSTVIPVKEYLLKIETERSPSKYVSAVVNALSSFQFTSCEKFKPADSELSGFGLLPPALTVQVDYTVSVDTYKKEDRTVTINIGGGVPAENGDASAAASFYAQLDGSNTVNTSSADAVTPLLDAVAAMGSVN